MSKKPWRDWANYDDVGRVLEIGVLFDDSLKKNSRFLAYSVLLANRICEDLGIKARVTWGKWGGRLDPLEKENRIFTAKELEKMADQIIEHDAWKALMESTRVFTYGRSSDD